MVLIISTTTNFLNWGKKHKNLVKIPANDVGKCGNERKKKRGFVNEEMWLSNSKGNGKLGRKGGGRNGLVAVAIDRDKGSQHALKWASENLIAKGQTIILIHVVHKSAPAPCTFLIRPLFFLVFSNLLHYMGNEGIIHWFIQAVRAVQLIKWKCMFDQVYIYYGDAVSNNYDIYDLNTATNGRKRALEKHTKELFLTFHCFCTRKNVRWDDLLAHVYCTYKNIYDH